MLTTGEPFHGHNASFPESQVVTTEPEAHPAPLHINHRTSAIIRIFTLGIPDYHASLAAIARNTTLCESTFSCKCNKSVKYYLDLKAAVPVWEAVRHFDTVLLAYVMIYHFAGGWLMLPSFVLQRYRDNVIQGIRPSRSRMLVFHHLVIVASIHGVDLFHLPHHHVLGWS